MAGDETTGQMGEPRVVNPDSIEVLDHRDISATASSPRSQYTFHQRKRLAILLFIVTCLSTFLAGSHLIDAFVNSGASLEIFRTLDLHRMLLDGALYGGSVMAILLAHEMGHYVQSRINHVPATMPLFIPMPISPFGTMGAVIIQGAGFANRKALFDIAITGPLAGLVLALPITYIGIQHSSIAHAGPAGAGLRFGEPLVFQWIVQYIHGPLPRGYEVMAHPMAFAGWVGIFITALNLIPIGQLDGGHILYTLIGKRAHYVAMALLWGAIAYMVLSRYLAYILMIFLLFMMGPKHPPTADDHVPLGTGRIILGWVTLSFIVVGFTPVPIF